MAASHNYLYVNNLTVEFVILFCYVHIYNLIKNLYFLFLNLRIFFSLFLACRYYIKFSVEKMGNGSVLTLGSDLGTSC